MPTNGRNKLNLIPLVLLLGAIMATVLFLARYRTSNRTKAGAINFQAQVNISQTPDAYFPAIFTDSNNKSHVIFGRQTQADGLWQPLYTDNVSGNWSAPKPIGNFDYRKGRIAGHPSNPAKIYIAYQAYRTHYGYGCDNSSSGGCSDIYFLESNDSGASWSAPLRLGTSNIHRYDPDIIVLPDNTIYVAYDGFNSLHVRRRDANGQWSSEQALPDYGSEVAFPALTWTQSGSTYKIHLLATPGQGGSTFKLTYSSSTDGQNWTSQKILASNLTTRKFSRLASDHKNNLYVIYADGNTGPIYFTSSSDTGQNWSSPKALNSGDSAFPDIALDSSGTVHAVWQQGFSSSSISYVQINGSEVSSPISPFTGNAKNPSLSTGPTSLNLVAHSQIGQYNVFYTTSAISAASGSNNDNTSVSSGDCQGNPNAPAKCFDCNKDGQINILDFSCFSKRYGQSVNNQENSSQSSTTNTNNSNSGTGGTNDNPAAGQQASCKFGGQNFASGQRIPNYSSNRCDYCQCLNGKVICTATECAMD